MQAQASHALCNDSPARAASCAHTFSIQALAAALFGKESQSSSAGPNPDDAQESIVSAILNGLYKIHCTA